MKFYPCNRDKCRFYREFETRDDGKVTLSVGNHKHDPLKEALHNNDVTGVMVSLLILRCLMCKYFEKQELYCK
jgi:MoaA/NifB/PqqE/SkfB family radical SAM enzyme